MMGNCMASMEEKERQELFAAQKRVNASLDTKLQADFADEKSVVKILLLGSGNSGKSTILKQFKLWKTEDGLGDESRNKSIISQNILTGLKVVVQSAFDLPNISGRLSPRSEAIFKILDESDCDNIWKCVHIGGEKVQLGLLCKELWQEPVVAEVMLHESKLSMLEVPIRYFMNDIDRINEMSYIPSEEDVLQSRARTSGVVTVEFIVDDTRCRMVDVGGQRNERKKWISHFDNVTAIVFLVSLSEYDKSLLEDATVNRMHDSLQVFQSIVDCPYFEQSSFILFLNKKDLFEEKLKTVDLSVCFPEYTGSQEYDEAVSYVQEKFVGIFRNSQSGSDFFERASGIYAFQTMATNKQNVRTVFDMCKHIVFKSNLVETGML